MTLSLNSHQLSVVPMLGMGPSCKSLPIYAGTLIGLILYRSCVPSQRCCELTCVQQLCSVWNAAFHRTHCASSFYRSYILPASSSAMPSSSLGWEWVGTDEPSTAEFSQSLAHSTSTRFESWHQLLPRAERNFSDLAWEQHRSMGININSEKAAWHMIISGSTIKTLSRTRTS